MDLIDRLKDSLSSIPGLPAKVTLGYVGSVDNIYLYPLPGSSVVDSDWAGNETKRMNYEIAIRTQDPNKGNGTLWRISDWLEQKPKFTSKNNSFKLNKIELNGEPYITEQDNQGCTTFMLDFYVEVITNRKQV